MQLLGGALALGAVLVLYPSADDLADDLAHLADDRSAPPHRSHDERHAPRRPVRLHPQLRPVRRGAGAHPALRRRRVEVRSAGCEPGNGVNPGVAAVLAERGLSTDDHAPVAADPRAVEGSDVVITMGCGETCPVFPGKRYEDWQVEDPKGQDLDTVRRIVDDVDRRVRALLAELGVETAPAPA